MRVIAGSLGGRTFDSPTGHRTHPMSEKARGALFNALGDIEGLCVLDAFSGSGAVAIEAISRGATTATAIERDALAVRTIRSNAQLLAVEQIIHVAAQSVASWSETHPEDVFDIVIADPPYDDIQERLLALLSSHVRQGGVFVVSLPGASQPQMFQGLSMLKTKELGDIQLVFYRKIQ